MSNNPVQHVNIEADRLAELSDRISDLVGAIELEGQDRVIEAASDVEIASDKANVNGDHSDIIDGLVNLIARQAGLGLSIRKRYALLHVVAAIEDVVEDDVSLRT